MGDCCEKECSRNCCMENECGGMNIIWIIILILLLCGCSNGRGGLFGGIF